jgi:hypothetical protein
LVLPPRKKQDSSFSEEKEAKRLLFLAQLLEPCPDTKSRDATKKGEVFLRLFRKTTEESAWLFAA